MPIIQLREDEQAELRSRAFPRWGEAPTIAAYWRGLYRARGITVPARTVPVGTPIGPSGQYSIAFHPVPLGPSAIAQGRAFRTAHEAKDRAFQAKQQTRGLQ